MKIKIILFFLSMAILHNAVGQDQIGKSINSGFVFIDGKYVEPPYLFEKAGNTVYLNGIQISETYVEPEAIIKTNDPGIPEIKKETTWDEYSKLINPKTGKTFIYDKLSYLYYTYKTPEIAKEKLEEYIRSLPNVKSYEDGEIITFNGEKKLFLFMNRGTESINEKLSTQIKLQSKVLNNGGLLAYFSSKNNVICKGSIISCGRFLFNLTESLTNGVKWDDLSKRKVYSNDIPKEEFLKLIENYNKKSEFLKRYNQLIDSLNKQFGNDWKKKNTTSSSNLNNSNKSTLNTSVNFSPDRDDVVYICPYTWDGEFDKNAMKILLESELSDNYNYREIIDIDNDGVLEFSTDEIKNISAGVLCLDAHGTPDQGGLITLYYGGDLLYCYNLIQNDPSLFLAQETFPPNPTVYNAVLANGAWFANNWNSRLTIDNSIILLSACYGSTLINSYGGGASFSFKNSVVTNQVVNNFTSVLDRMNGNDGDGSYRNAEDAYNEDFSPFWSNLQFHQNSPMTLYPAISSYYPQNGDVVPVSYDGYIELDTWCDPANTPVSNAVSFVTSGVTITNIAWDNSSVTNKINYHWNGNGTVTVNVNSSAFHSSGNGGDLNGYHTLDFNPSTPLCENGSYTFTTSSTVATPNANFTFSTQSAVSPDYTVAFTDASLFAPTSWSWDFGDAGTSNNQNPSHPYYNPGTYTVTLTVTNAFGSHTISRPVVISPNNPLEPLNIGCYVFSNTGYVSSIVNSECQVWSGTAPFTYEFSHSVDNSLIGSQSFSNENSFTKSMNVTLNSTPTSNEKLIWKVTDSNGNIGTCSDIIDVISNSDESYIFANYSLGQNCDYVVDINNPVTFVDMSYSIQPESCPIAYWEWAFDWDTNSDDCSWWDSWHPATSCHWDQNYSTYQSTVTHPYTSVGVKTIRLLASSAYDPNGTAHDSQTPGNCHRRGYFWGGIYAINCDLISTFLHLDAAPLGQGGFDGFVGALRNDQWNPSYIYGGIFNFNGNANNYLNTNNIHLSACKEIVIQGDVEFIATGNNELILEINENECLQNSTKNIVSLFSNNEDYSIDKNELKKEKIDNENNIISSFPNPFVSEIEINSTSNLVQSIKLIDVNGIIVLFKNFDSPISHWIIDTKKLPPGVYLLEVKGQIKNVSKKIIKISNT